MEERHFYTDNVMMELSEDESENRILDFSNQEIGNEKIEEIIHQISMNSSVNQLVLTNVQISTPGWKKLIIFLAHNHSITYLDLSNNDLSTNEENHRWKKDIFKENHRWKKDIFEELLKFNSSISTLFLNNCQLTSDDIQLFLNSIGDNEGSSINTLVLSGNNIENTGLEAFGKFLLSPNRTLKNLFLANCNITSIEPIALGLQKKSSLKEINLSQNPIGNQGAHVMAWVLQNNRAIETLELNNCLIGPEGAYHLANALKYNRKLSMLSLAHNSIGDEGISYFTEVFKAHNRTAGFCNFEDNKITFESIANITKMIEKNCILKVFRVFSRDEIFEVRPLNNAHFRDFRDILQNNFTLTHLGGFRLDFQEDDQSQIIFPDSPLNVYHEIWDYLERNNEFVDLYLRYQEIVIFILNANSIDKESKLSDFLKEISEIINFDINSSMRAPMLNELSLFSEWCALEKSIKYKPFLSLHDPHKASSKCLDFLRKTANFISEHYPNETAQFDLLFHFLWIKMSKLFPHSFEIKKDFYKINQSLFLPCLKNIFFEEEINDIKNEISKTWQTLYQYQTSQGYYSVECMKDLEKRLNYADSLIRDDKQAAHEILSAVLNELKEMLEKQHEPHLHFCT